MEEETLQLWKIAPETFKLLTYLYLHDSKTTHIAIPFMELTRRFEELSCAPTRSALDVLGDGILHAAERVAIENPSIRFQIDFVAKDHDFICYKVTNPHSIEERFRERASAFRQTHYKFHGSGIHNWYSLVVNGIKNYSGTAKMAHGSAYGSGVYLSSAYGVSNGYTNARQQAMIPSIIGVYEVLGEQGTYQRSDTVWVVPDETQLILRYILVNFTHQPVGSWLDLRFSKTVDLNRCKGSKRLWKEYQATTRISHSTGIYVDVSDSNLFEWSVRLTAFDRESLLHQDMARLGVSAICLQVIFSYEYPHHPPFIYVVHPKFAERTAHVTSQGALCLELLTPSGWSQLMTMENLLVQIKTLLVEGGGRLVPGKKPYELQRAKESFSAIASHHGWTK